MLIFFTILFIAIYTISLIKGSPFKDELIQIGEAEIRIAQGENKEDVYLEKNIILSSIKIFIISITIIISQLIYFIVALKYDVLLYPTILIMSYVVTEIVYQIIFKRNSDLKLNSEKEIQKFKNKLYGKTPLKSTLINIVFLSYFIYMFYILVIN